MICKKCKLDIRSDCVLWGRKDVNRVCVFCHYKTNTWDSNGASVTKQEAIGRDPKRIKRILKKVEVLWNRYDDWRLGQVIINLINSEYLDLFYLEDEKLEELLLSYNIKKRSK